MSDIFREVDEALQREKAEKFWHEYGPTLFACAVLLVVGTALGVAWRTWNHERNETATAQLVTAIDSKDTAILQTVIEDSRSGPEAIAIFSAAQTLIGKDDKEGAAALYKQAAEDRSTPKNFRDLARILYVRTAPEVTTEQKREALAPALSHTSSPFIWQARIEAAVIEAEEEKFQEAVKHLESFGVAENNIPPSLRERGNALRQLYTIKAQEVSE